MIREVYIDGQLVDIDNNSTEGYLLYSPIFREISSIVANRTTAYKIPVTAKNDKAFNLLRQPDIKTDYSMKWHDYEEWRDGLPFIKGQCRINAVTGQYYEMSVMWGNGINLRRIRDRKLRDMDITDYIEWNDTAQYMGIESTDQIGFLKIDFGQGIDNIKMARPCIKFNKILEYLKQSEKVEFTYPSRFNNLFNTIWIPLIDNNSSQFIWDNYFTVHTIVNRTYYQASGGNINGYALYLELYKTSGNKDLIGSLTVGNYGEATLSYIKNNNAPISIRSEKPFYIKVNTTDPNAITWSVKFMDQYFPVEKTENGYAAYCDIDVSLDSEIERTFPNFQLLNGENQPLHVGILSFVADECKLIMQVQKQTVDFGEKFPIVTNLPDMKIVDFIKTIMNMFGLFTYYRDNKRNNEVDVVQFISIDDMYDNIPKAYNWTDKIIRDAKNGITLKRIYGDYAQKNYMKYKNDKEVKIKTDSFIQIEDTTLAETKDLFTIPFSASNNNRPSSSIGAADNAYASIPIFDKDGKASTAIPRILVENVYRVKQGNGEDLDFISGYFPDTFKFGGQSGLISQHYKQYQAVLRNPVSIEVSVKFSSAELATLDERLPVFIDGVHYMPTNWTIYPNDYAVCKLLKMPPL